MAHVTAIIPARLESTRFPRKPLHPIKGKPMVYHVWAAAGSARLIDQVFVATDAEEIGRVVNGFGGAVIMTSSRPRNGSERAAEAIRSLKTDIIVNVQADNIGLTGAVLDRVLKAMLADRSIQYATLARPITGRDWKDKLYNPDVVKVVADRDGHAIWFSRYPIPFVQKPTRRAIDVYPFLEHIGVYFYRKAALETYADWPRGKAEAAESLEQLRILENGGAIRLFMTRCAIQVIDRPMTEKKGTRKR